MVKKRRGKFITLEGGEGAGKSTQAELIDQYFKHKGETTLLVREPGTTKIGEKIRKIISTNNDNA